MLFYWIFEIFSVYFLIFLPRFFLAAHISSSHLTTTLFAHDFTIIIVIIVTVGCEPTPVNKKKTEENEKLCDDLLASKKRGDLNFKWRMHSLVLHIMNLKIYAFEDMVYRGKNYVKLKYMLYPIIVLYRTTE